MSEPEIMPRESSSIKIANREALSFSTAWQNANLLQKGMFLFLSGGTVVSASMFAIGQFFQTRGVQSMLTSRVFLIAALIFPIIGIWRLAFLLNSTRWKWIALAATLLLCAGAYALDRAFPMPSKAPEGPVAPPVATSTIPEPPLTKSDLKAALKELHAEDKAHNPPSLPTPASITASVRSSIVSVGNGLCGRVMALYVRREANARPTHKSTSPYGWWP